MSMRFFPISPILLVISLVLSSVIIVPGTAQAQQSSLRVSLTDSDDRSVAGAHVSALSGSLERSDVSDSSGVVLFSFPAGGTVNVHVVAAGFAEESRTITVTPGVADFPITVRLRPVSHLSEVTVTASRTPLAADASAASTVTLSQLQLQRNASLTLDDKLRQVPGVELFRRSSSRVANPTSQGISLRGLGSTAASRTLLVSDLVPLNDAFGGWIHWNELPALAVERVEIVRGGGSDLYGSSAIGGVINLVAAQPQFSTQQFAFNGGYGGENTPFGDALWTGGTRKLSALAAASIFRTEGYIPTAPSQRGAVDVPSNVHYQSGRLEIANAITSSAEVFLRGNFYNEARSNGTPDQTNATRLWRYAGGGNVNYASAGTFAVRAYGSNENYRQSFSAIAPGRASERLTRLQRTPAQEFGAAGQWSKSFATYWTLLAGADTRDVRATDREVPIVQGVPSGLSDTSARQRQTGLYAEALFDRGPWSVALSGRLDRFSNFDTHIAITSPSGSTKSTNLPDRDETVGDPRLGVVRRLGHNISLSGSAFRAFRSATLNELYRTGQVGQEITLPNPDLKSERATGAEGGVLFELPSHNTTVRASYFYTQVNRPITALTLNIAPTQIIKQRENLGQLRSRGVSFDAETRPATWLTITGGYQYADAVVTEFKPQPRLVGNWLPQVPRNTGTAQVIFNKRALGTLAFFVRGSGRQFDDDQNLFPLHSFFRFDIYAEHDFGHHVQVYSSVENIADRAIQVGRTPVLTLGQPRVAVIGVRFAGASR